jgi:hypothetical protein
MLAQLKASFGQTYLPDRTIADGIEEPRCRSFNITRWL